MVFAAIASARSAAALASLAACSTRLAAAWAEAAACWAFWLAASAREAAWSARFAAFTARCAGSGAFEQPAINERANTAPANPTSLQDFVINPSIFSSWKIARQHQSHSDQRPRTDPNFVSNPLHSCKLTQRNKLLQRASTNKSDRLIPSRQHNPVISGPYQGAPPPSIKSHHPRNRPCRRPYRHPCRRPQGASPVPRASWASPPPPPPS